RKRLMRSSPIRPTLNPKVLSTRISVLGRSSLYSNLKSYWLKPKKYPQFSNGSSSFSRFRTGLSLNCAHKVWPSSTKPTKRIRFFFICLTLSVFYRSNLMHILLYIPWSGSGRIPVGCIGRLFCGNVYGCRSKCLGPVFYTYKPDFFQNIVELLPMG